MSAILFGRVGREIIPLGGVKLLDCLFKSWLKKNKKRRTPMVRLCIFKKAGGKVYRWHSEPFNFSAQQISYSMQRHRERVAAPSSELTPSSGSDPPLLLASSAFRLYANKGSEWRGREQQSRFVRKQRSSCCFSLRLRVQLLSSSVDTGVTCA